MRAKASRLLAELGGTGDDADEGDGLGIRRDLALGSVPHQRKLVRQMGRPVAGPGPSIKSGERQGQRPENGGAWLIPREG